MDNRTKNFSTLVGNCPSCSGYVRVPLDARADAAAKCPHCSNTFSVSAVLEQIPELEIVESLPLEKVVPLVDRQPIIKEAIVERKKFAVPHQLITGSKKKRRRRGQSDSRPSLGSSNLTDIAVEPSSSMIGTGISPAGDVDPSSVTIDPEKSMDDLEDRSSARSISSANAARVRVHSSQRHRRIRDSQQSKKTFEAIKIVLGGLLAFPIAYLILLWGIGQDPLNLVPALSKSIPFAVPKKLQIAPQEPVRRKRIVGGEKTGVTEPKQKPELEIETRPNFIPGVDDPEKEIFTLPDVAPESPGADNSTTEAGNPVPGKANPGSNTEIPLLFNSPSTLDNFEGDKGSNDKD